MATKQAGPGSVYVDASKIEWEPTKFPGVACKVLYRDSAGDAFTALFKFEPGARLPRHRHAGIEQSYVLSGSLVDAAGACMAGNFVWRQAGSVHDAHSPDGCIVLGIFQKANEFLE